MPPARYEELKQVIQGMIDSGVIRESHSPWAAPIVMVTKKDGSTRLCIDYRKLNARTIRDAYALPRIDECFDALKGAALFSTLDLKSGYWQVAMDERDIEKTAFITPVGHYECMKLPMGLATSASEFQRIMEKCLKDHNYKTRLAYHDDILVFSTTFNEHLHRLQQVFHRLIEAGLKLKAKKCEFFLEKVRYLGHVVSKEGIQTDPGKTNALREWPVPTNAREVKTFLGLTG